MRLVLLVVAAGVVAGGSLVASAAPRLCAMTSPTKFRLARYRRDRGEIQRLVYRHFDVLRPHLAEVVRDCPRPRGLVKIRHGDSPFLIPSPYHSGPQLVRKHVRDRLIFAAAFAQARGFYRIAVGIGYRSLRTQVHLWNWRLVERFGELLRRHRDKVPLAELARRARPTGEVANPRALGCRSPHLTGSAVDVMLLDVDDEILVGFRRAFYYGSKGAYRRRFLLSDSEDAYHARLLEEVMHGAGFVRYCREAWHFETHPAPMHRAWTRAGSVGRCFGAGRGGTWDPRRQPALSKPRLNLLADLPRPVVPVCKAPCGG